MYILIFYLSIPSLPFSKSVFFFLFRLPFFSHFQHLSHGSIVVDCLSLSHSQVSVFWRCRAARCSTPGLICLSAVPNWRMMASRSAHTLTTCYTAKFIYLYQCLTLLICLFNAFCHVRFQSVTWRLHWRQLWTSRQSGDTWFSTQLSSIL